MVLLRLTDPIPGRLSRRYDDPRSPPEGIASAPGARYILRPAGVRQPAPW
ncbi:hypothetical protein GCM10010921_14630 [Microbacterium album]|uniref:Uncharacterized protein n=1 Tax=Microbacterium album TaxID=2053191 RepID=A0A917IFQ8_9MICO|nr:hypothetical protein GCM10010921_14630 [Microbacterium album]